MYLALIISTILILLIIVNNCYYSTITTRTTVYAQPSPSKTQTWIDKQNNIKIQFASQPENPIVDKPTELRFGVRDLKSGEYLKNLLARVVVTDGQRSFKFTNIAVPDGIFSVKYLFPDSGTFQVIGRVDDLDDNNSYHFSTLSSFQVFVPLQINGGNISIIAITTAAIVGVIVFVSIQFVLNKRKKEREYGLH
jgi:hypothetical protein